MNDLINKVIEGVFNIFEGNFLGIIFLLLIGWFFIRKAYNQSDEEKWNDSALSGYFDRWLLGFMFLAIGLIALYNKIHDLIR